MKPVTPKGLALAALVTFAAWFGILYEFSDTWNHWAPNWFANLLLVPIGLLAAAILAKVIQIGVRSAKD